MTEDSRIRVRNYRIPNLLMLDQFHCYATCYWDRYRVLEAILYFIIPFSLLLSLYTVSYCLSCDQRDALCAWGLAMR